MKETRLVLRDHVAEAVAERDNAARWRAQGLVYDDRALLERSEEARRESERLAVAGGLCIHCFRGGRELAQSECPGTIKAPAPVRLDVEAELTTAMADGDPTRGGWEDACFTPEARRFFAQHAIGWQNLAVTVWPQPKSDRIAQAALRAAMRAAVEELEAERWASDAAAIKFRNDHYGPSVTLGAWGLLTAERRDFWRKEHAAAEAALVKSESKKVPLGNSDSSPMESGQPPNRVGKRSVRELFAERAPSVLWAAAWVLAMGLGLCIPAILLRLMGVL